MERSIKLNATAAHKAQPGAIIVTGRADGFLPVNHASRPYYAMNQKLEGAASHLRYYEVKHAHHLDALNGTAGFDALYIPLNSYYIRSLDLMFEHLQAARPAAGEALSFENGLLSILE